jgi:ELWxxDGT repeat protein
MVDVLEDRCLPASGLSAALVADILPGSSGSNPAHYVVLINTLYFAANDGVHGTELYKSDGTAAGTVLVKDMNPGSGDSNPTDLTPVGSTLYFRADDGVHGQELWKTDGTTAGTVLVKDISPGSGGSTPSSSGVEDMADINGTLFLSANDGVHGPELWKSDGTAAGTVLVKDINSGSAGSYPTWLTNVNGVAFFSANDGKNGTELWKSDGTARGTKLVADIFPGDIYIYNTCLFDCFGKTKTRPIDLGPASSDPSWLTNVNGTLFFVAADSQDLGGGGIPYLYKSDGTGGGTKRVADVVVGSGLLNVNGTLFFNGGGDLYKSDGTAAGTVQVADIYPGANSDPIGLTNVNGTVFFVADDGVRGRELWRTDGTAAGTVLVKDINPGSSSSPSRLTNVNGLLYFTAADGVHGRELWQSDGTEAGTVMVQDINPGSAASDPQDLVAMNNKLYFSAADGVHGRELWDPPLVLGPLVQASGPSPFAGSTADNPAGQPGVYSPNSEAEPYVAVNPTNAKNVVAVWQQDLWSNAAGRGVVAGVSFDGGDTWRQVVIPGITLVSGGTYQRAGDNWLSFSPNGDLYEITLAANVTQAGKLVLKENAVLVSKSTDGGLTWGNPIPVVQDGSSVRFDDKDSVTADPTNSNFVYAVWDRVNNFQSYTQGVTQFARSTDGGRTWEAPRAIFTSPQEEANIGHQILVRPDGTLIDLFTEVNPHGHGPALQLMALRSTDKGLTWGAPVPAAQLLLAGTTDPDTGQAADDGEILAHYAVDPNNGNLYAVWADGRFSSFQYNSIAFTMSTDGGLSWSAPIRVNQTPDSIPAANRQAFLPSVAVATDGTVAVTYYDFRNNTSAAGVPTDYWMVHADPRDGLTNPASWHDENRLTNVSFDYEQAAPRFGGAPFLGDYEGLAAAGTSFFAVWTQPQGSDRDSIFFRDPPPSEAAAVGPSGAAATLPYGQVAPLPPGAVPRWQGAGVDPAALAGLDIRIADLGGTPPAMAAGHTIWFDATAAGWGWFVDPTPWDDSEFTTPGDQGEQHRMDLLTVVMHEMGHVLGYDHEATGVMRDTLSAGAREWPNGLEPALFRGEATEGILALRSLELKSPDNPL